MVVDEQTLRQIEVNNWMAVHARLEIDDADKQRLLDENSVFNLSL